MLEKTLSAQFLLTLIQQLQHSGIARESVEQEIGVTIIELQKAADQNRGIALARYGKLYRFYLQQMRGENFGFADNIGDMTGRYRMLFILMINSKDLGSALSKLQDFYTTFAIDKQLFRFHQCNQQVICELKVLMQEKYRRDGNPAVINANLASGLHRVMCWLTGIHIPLDRVEISARTPAHPHSYDALFSCPVQFEQLTTALVMNAEAMKYGIVQTESTLAEFLQQFPESLFDNPAKQQQSCSDRVQAIIGHKLHRDIPSVKAVSLMLNMSELNLKKKLKADGLSYHKMIELARQQQAITLLTQSTLALNTIAEQLGFTATSAFHRSFKRWTGLTPGEYREKAPGSTTDSSR